MKRFHRSIDALRRLTPFLYNDGTRLVAATVIVGTVLCGVYSLTAYQAANLAIEEAAIANRLTDSLRQQALAAEARRLGSVVFASADKLCEEFKFDNTTGYFVGIEMVDCEERLTREAVATKEAAKTAGMKGMLTSFKR